MNEATAGQPTCYIKHIREKLLVHSTSTLSLLLFYKSYLFNQIIVTTIVLLLKQNS